MAIKLGNLVRDVITGFSGIATGRTDYMYGCAQVCITPDRLTEDGKRIEAEWFDEQRIETVEARAIPMSAEHSATSGDETTRSDVEQLGRFGHHPDPATDFCEEVGCCENAAYELHFRATSRADLLDRIGRAMQFRVGGDASCVDAKHALRQLEQAVEDGTEREYTEALFASRAKTQSDVGGEVQHDQPRRRI